jgi:DUF1680 family protein
MDRLIRFFIAVFLIGTAGLAAAAEASEQSPVAPSFRWLKQGEVKPAGWLKAQMERDLREGSIGHLDELAPQASSDIFVTGRNAPGKPNAYSQAGQTGEVESWGNGETEGNWRTGYIRTAYLIGDIEAKRKADAYVRHILQSQDKDGYIGIYSPELRYPQSQLGSELWTETTILRGLLAYYELTGDTEVLRAVERAAQLSMTKYGPGKMTAFQIPNYDCGVSHGLMFVDVLERLYDLTGNQSYRDFGLWLYQDFSAAKDWIANGGMNYWGDAKLAALLDLQKPLVGHGATTNEHIRVPVWAYIVTGNPDFKRAYENALIKVKQISFPSGATIAEEDSRGMKPDPTTTFYEFCALKELLMSYCSGLQKLGKSELGDRIEKLMFNAVQGSRAPGGKGVAYCTRDNRYSVDGAVANRDKFSPTHSDVAVCCNPNFAQTTPDYIRGMWMRTPDDGLAALLYGPSYVDTNLKGVGVRIDEATDYPFSATISLTVSPEQPVEFPLVLRNPGWSESTQVTCQGASVSKNGDYFLVRKRWTKGDQVKIVFSESIIGIPAWNAEIALQRGPLVYALTIPSVKFETKHYSLPGFADLEYSSALGAQWWYALDPSLGKGDFGFTARGERDANKPYPFDGAPVRLEGKLINLDTGRREDVSLVPMGSSLAILRRVTFPVGGSENK